ncbi:peptidylprolyl isomerase [Ranunculus cassubicifolius]
MAFWGVEVKPGKPYRLDGVGGRLHISKATLGDGKSSKKSFVQCTVGDKSPVLLCCLKPDQSDSCSLHVEFAEYDEVSFEVLGSRSVHLVGHYLDRGANFGGDGDDSESYGEDIGESDSEQSSDFSTDDEYGGGEFIDDDDFDFVGDDDTEMLSSSPKRNSGVIIEEIDDDENTTNGNADGKQVSDGEKQIIASGGTSIFESGSEDEDGLPIPRSKTKDKSVEKQKKHEKKASKGNKKKADDAVDQVVRAKRKSEDVQDGETKRGTEEPSELPSSENGQDTVDKPKKKKKKEETKEEAKTEEVKTDNITQEEPIREEAAKKPSTDSLEIVDKEEDTSGKKKKKKKKNKKNKTEDSTEESKKDSIVEVEDKPKEEAKPTQERTYANGLVVEELEMGKPDAKRANPGNKVSVCYIGKLKKNGKIFDSCTNRKVPFQFRLGVGQVIKGWDVGVSGMRVGDKRRLTIPPSMGYGAKGAGPAIPPNAWLVFDVELIATR